MEANHCLETKKIDFKMIWKFENRLNFEEFFEFLSKLFQNVILKMKNFWKNDQFPHSYFKNWLLAEILTWKLVTISPDNNRPRINIDFRPKEFDFLLHPVSWNPRNNAKMKDFVFLRFRPEISQTLRILNFRQHSPWIFSPNGLWLGGALKCFALSD